ncbi:nucleotide-binding universal stress UspA family protein [Hamadaea flava]|uniref:Universal stress protein n=1 Tax=Hamadaea flava TaxID=1742688 RepID=A0ABV8LS65_9ACTN|nr:universal stress protein [Hamadaea flava]MCP2328753.1 nucleotide-binding universal stress UspA family protein [Hamadaea flava]
MNFRIVVGIDGSEAARRALHWAVTEAEVRDGTVQAIAVWHWDGSGTFAPMATTPAEERDRAQAVLTREVESMVKDFPTVAVTADIIEGHPARELTKAARDADLLALGSHGHSHLYQSVLGSISDECVRTATCPVVVLPATRAQAVAPAEALANSR